ncbi:hypothetical protein Gotri_028008 [Gossypium trilobum]|uniref:Uncharacterized protein n=1 Tax=Gossypium trilobum TaxID=34281 RepID=A0A7J9FSC7_9ROSI|nr:hypothetical protein [Gossypium trilobum]
MMIPKSGVLRRQASLQHAAPINYYKVLKITLELLLYKTNIRTFTIDYGYWIYLPRLKLQCGRSRGIS